MNRKDKQEAKDKTHPIVPYWPYLAITSTYRPLLRPFLVPALRGPGAAPSRSSILLASLMLVAGRLGGPLAALAVDEVRAMAGGIIGGALPGGGGAEEGGGVAMPIPDEGGAGVDVAECGLDRGGGGGGVDLAVWSSGPAFLLIQRFSSGSK